MPMSSNRRASGRTARRIARLPAVAGAMTSLASVAAGATPSWTNPAGGNWSEGAYWSTGAVPVGFDTAVFDLGSAPPGYFVSFPASVNSPVTLAVRNDTVTLAPSAGVVVDVNKVVLAGAAGQNASLTVAGGTLDFFDATFAAAGSATLNVMPGAAVVGHGTITFGAAGGSVALNVGGAGARLQAPTLQAGTLGTTTLNVTAGGVVTDGTGFGTATFAGTTGGSAAVTVEGAGSLLSYGSLNLAAVASTPSPTPSFASLVARDGARVAVTTLYAGGGGSTATLSFDGPGTALDADGGVQLASGSLSFTNGAALTAGLVVGKDGTATVAISSGSVVDTGGGTVNAGSSVTIGSDTAATSNWTTDDLSINAGGTVTVGAGGRLSVDATLRGTGTLRLAGGQATIGETFFFHGTLAGAGSVTGRLGTPSFTIDPDGTLDITNGAAASHSLFILNPYRSLNLDITSASVYDRLVTSNTVRYHGTLAVSLDPSYVPAAGDAFDLLDVYARDGASTFETVSLPPLPVGLAWDTSALYTTGTIGVVVPEPALLAPVLGLLLAGRRRERAAR